MKINLYHATYIAGFSGPIIIAVCSVITMLAYRGRMGQAYSPLADYPGGTDNHQLCRVPAAGGNYDGDQPGSACPADGSARHLAPDNLRMAAAGGRHGLDGAGIVGHAPE